jgi:hypothetical protein
MSAKNARKTVTREAERLVALRRSNNKERQEVKLVQATSDKILGNYCNVAVIKHTIREFVLDFLLVLDNNSVLASRVITSPQHAKELSQVLGQNIEKYEKKYGQIVLKREE